MTPPATSVTFQSCPTAVADSASGNTSLRSSSMTRRQKAPVQKILVWKKRARRFVMDVAGPDDSRAGRGAAEVHVAAVAVADEEDVELIRRPDAACPRGQLALGAIRLSRPKPGPNVDSLRTLAPASGQIAAPATRSHCIARHPDSSRPLTEEGGSDAKLQIASQ